MCGSVVDGKSFLRVLLILFSVGLIAVVYFFDSNKIAAAQNEANHTDLSNDDLIDDHYKKLQAELPKQFSGKLIPHQELLKGPEKLVELISDDQQQQWQALTALQSDMAFETYGNEILPYLAYVIADLENRKNSRVAFRLLRELSMDLALKAHRGILSTANKQDLENFIRQKGIDDIPELTAYPPLKPILYYTLANSSVASNREASAWILAEGYEESREVEEALVQQFKNEGPNTGVRFDIIGAVTSMTFSSKYENGFLSPLTAKTLVVALDTDFLYSVSFLIGRYEPDVVVDQLMSIISSGTSKRVSSALVALSSYGSHAAKYVQQLEQLRDDERDDKRRSQLETAIRKLLAEKNES